MPSVTTRKTALRLKKPVKKSAVRTKKPFKLELTREDIPVDNAVSAAAARSLAARRK